MSKEVIDEKVVELQFKNDVFEKNVKESMSTLDKLKQKLQLKGAAKAAESEFEAYKSGMFSFKDSVLKMWSSLEYEVAGKMKNLLKQFTIEPIKQGLDEYETQMGAIQTILANTQSKGTTLDEVNEALNQLNEYADKTIYNFTEMTKNIGTFTAAGVDLETSVNAIQGIANLAAVSGSTSQQASTAMYQLSQALSSGTVKLMDWNSVVNAGMGGQVFQDALKETARIHGIAIDDMIKEQGSFRETLQEGWLTSEILTETLQKFTLGTEGLTEEQIEANRVMLRAKGYTEEQIDAIFELGNTATNAATKIKTFSQLMDTLKESAQSGWSQTWSIIIGDFEEAKELWTRVSDTLGGIIGASADARNALLRGGLDTGWDKFMDAGIIDEEGFMHYFKEIAKEHEVDIDQMIKDQGSLEKALVQGFNEGIITSDMFIQSLDQLTKAYENCSDEELAAKGYTRAQVEEMVKLNSQLQNGEISIEEFTEAMSKLSGRTLVIESLANLFRALMNVVKPIKEAFTDIFPTDEGKKLYSFTEAFYTLTSSIEKFTEKHGNQIKRTFKGIFAVLDIGIRIIKIFASAIGKVIEAFTGPMTGGILNVTASIGDFLVSIRDLFVESKGLEEFANGVADAIINIVNSYKAFFAATKEKIKASGFDGFLNTLKGIWNFVKNLISKILDLFGSLGAGIVETLNGTSIDTVLDLLNAGLLTALLVKFKGLFDGAKKIKEAFCEVLDSVTGSLEAFQNRLQAETIKTIAVSVAILAASILVLSFIDKEKLEQSLAAITMLFGVLMGAIAVINKTAAGVKQTAVSTGLLIGLATSLFILSFTLVRLGKLAKNGDMVSGLVAMTSALGVLVGAIHVLSLVKNREGYTAIERSIGQLRIIAWAMIPLAVALKILSTMSLPEMGVAIGSLVAGLGAMVGAIHLLALVKTGEKGKLALDGAKQLSKIAWAMIAMSVAIVLLCAVMSRMDDDDLKKVGIVLGGLLVALVAMIAVDKFVDKVSANKPGKIKVVMDKAVKMAALGAALGLLAVSLLLIATLDWDEITKSLVTIGLAISMLGVTLWALNKIEFNEGINTKVLALLTLTGALTLMAIALKALGRMKWPTIGRGLAAMAGTLVILLGALKAIEKFSDSGKGGGYIAGVAGSLMLLALALAMLSTVMIAAGTAKFSTILKGFTTFALVIGSIALAAKLLEKAIPTLMTFAGSLALIGVACLAAGAGMYLLAAGLTLVGSGLGSAIESLCQALIQSADSIGKASAALLIGIINALVDVTDELVSGLLEIILNTLQSLAKFIPEIADALMDLILGVGEKLIEYVPEIVALATKLIGKIFEGVVDAIKNIKAEDIMPLVLAVGAITVLMKAFAAAKVVAKDAIIGVLAVGAVLLELVVILGIIGLLYLIPGFGDVVSHGSKLVKCLNNVLLVLAAVTALFAPLAIIGALVTALGPLSILAAAAGLAAVSVIMAELVVLMAAFGDFAYDKNLIDGIKKCGEILYAIGEAFGQGIGGFIGGIGVGVTKSMIQMAEDLSVFAEKLKPFLESIKAVDNESLTAVLNLAAMLAVITGTSLFTKAVEMFTMGGNPIEEFSENLLLFGSAICEFSEEVEDSINVSAVETATKAGTAVAKMASEIPITGGLWGNEAGSLKKFSKNLPLFGESIVSFYEAIDDADIDTSEGGPVKTAAEAGAIIAAMASKIPITGGLWGNDAGDLGSFGKNIKTFGEGIANFCTTVNNGNIDLITVEPAVKAGTDLAEMASKIPVTGGLWGNDAGSLATFSANIGYFAEGITAFSNSVTKNPIDVKAVTNAALAGGELAILAGNIPKSIGVWGNDKGSNNMTSFANQIGIFGNGLANFVESVSGITSFDNVTPAALAGGELALLAGNIPNFIGVWGNDKGGKNMLSFKEQIVLFGEGMVGFANSIAGLTSFDNVEPAAKAGAELAKLTSQLPNFIGVWGNDKGSKNMASFKEQIGMFGEGIKNFKDKIGTDADYANAIDAAEAGVKIAEITSTMSTDNVNNMSTFSDELPGLGTAIDGFCTNISDISFADIATSIGNLSTLFITLNGIVKTGCNSLTEKFSSATDDLTDTISKMIDSMIDELQKNSVGNKFEKAGKEWIKQLKKGIKDQKSKAVDAVEDVTSKAAKAAKNKDDYDKFYAAGKYYMDGLASGINDGAAKVVAAAEAVASAVNKAIKGAWLINSPSKAAYENGSFYTMGLINALNDGSQDAFSAAGGLAEMATKGLKGAISKVKDLIENGIDTQPTIRPVLDLSDVNNKVGVMNGMLSMSPSVGVLGKVNTISSSMNKNQNGQNSEILTTMDKILNKLDNASGDTININGVTYDDGSQLQEAIELIIRAANIERRK